MKKSEKYCIIDINSQYSWMSNKQEVWVGVL